MTKHNLEETGDWVFVETGFLLRASMPAHNQSTQFYTSLHSYKMDSEDASAVANIYKAGTQGCMKRICVNQFKICFALWMGDGVGEWEMRGQEQSALVFY